MSEHRQRSYTSQRIALSPAFLQPPLRLCWQLRGARPSVGAPLVARDRLVTWQGERWTTVGLDERGKVRWRVPGEGRVGAIVGNSALLRVDTRLLLVDLRTGRVSQEQPLGTEDLDAVTAGEDRFLTRQFPDAVLTLREVGPRFRRVWSTDVARLLGTSGELDLPLAADAQRCLALIKSDSGSRGAVVALELSRGELVWTARVDDVDELPRAGLWNPVVVEGLLVVSTANGTAAFDLRDGHKVWFKRTSGSRTAYANGLFFSGRNWKSVDQPSEVVVVDARTGSELWRRDYPELQRKGRANRIAGHLGVSETHLWAGDDYGWVWAFDRESGEPVWKQRPKGSETFAPWTHPVIAGGRLYLASTGATSYLHCFEETGGTGRKAESSPDSEKDGGAESEGRMEFAIDQLYEGQALEPAKPYFRRGGAWTVLRCALGERGAFYLAHGGEKRGSGFSSGEGRIWVVSCDDGDKLLKAMAHALGTRRPTRVGQAFKVRPPTSLSLVYLGQEQGWTVTKWSAEGGSPEFYVRWSARERRGYISEKDDSYRRDLLGLFASLVARR